MPTTCGGWQEMGPLAADSQAPPPSDTKAACPGLQLPGGASRGCYVNFRLRKEILPQAGTLSMERDVTKDSLSHPRRTQARRLPEGIGVPNRQVMGAATS